MQKVIIAIGELKSGPEHQLFNQFYKRMQPPPLMQEIPNRNGSSPKADADLILKHIKNDDYVIILDEGGNNLKTRDLYKKVEDLENNQGFKRMVFVIGGADGLHTTIKARANLSIAFGCATWPHMLVRGLLMEQLYRIQQIKNGHPYHRD